MNRRLLRDGWSGLAVVCLLGLTRMLPLGWLLPFNRPARVPVHRVRGPYSR